MRPVPPAAGQLNITVATGAYFGEFRLPWPPYPYVTVNLPSPRPLGLWSPSATDRRAGSPTVLFVPCIAALRSFSASLSSMTATNELAGPRSRQRPEGVGVDRPTQPIEIRCERPTGRGQTGSTIHSVANCCRATAGGTVGQNFWVNAAFAVKPKGDAVNGS